jgi:hypothetical protein
MSTFTRIPLPEDSQYGSYHGGLSVLVMYEDAPCDRFELV